jgi:hypothetical protein
MKKKTLPLFVVLAIIIAIAGTSCKKEASNGSPVITSVLVNPGSISANGSVSVTVTATDPNGDALTYSYSPNGGAISGSGPAVSWTAPSTEGSYSVNVTVSDGKGGTATMSGSLIVLPSAAYVPTFSSTSIAIDATTIDFYITCTSDDYDLVKVDVIYPGGLGTETYTGPLNMTMNSPITFPNFFTRMSGTWTFKITGTVSSGTHIGTSFVATTTVTVSGK